MTALPLPLDDQPGRGPARRKPWHGSLMSALVLAFALALAFAAPVRADDEPVKGEVRVANEGGFTRLVFRLDETVDAKVRLSGAILVVTFKKPVAIAVDRINAGSPDFISAARSDPDGSAIRIALARKVRVNAIPAAERLYVDLLPEGWTGTLPGLPQDVVDELANRARVAERALSKQRQTTEKAKTPTIRVKVVKLPTFMRYVFDMPERASVVSERGDDVLRLRFDQPIKWDLADAIATLPSTLESVSAEAEFDQVAVMFQLNGAPEARSFREDRSIVVDIGLGEGAAAAAQAGEGAATKTAAEVVPAIARPDTVPAKDAPALKDAPAAAAPMAVPPANAPAADVAKPQAAATIEPPAKPEAKVEAKSETKVEAKAESKPEPKLETKPEAASAKPAPDMAAKPVIVDTSHDVGTPPAPNPNAPVVAAINQTGGNLRIEFPFAVPTPAAVFSRADTLWMIFDSAARIDLARLAGASLQTIRQATSARGPDGAAVVRIRLARPLLASFGAEGPAWVLNIGDNAKTPTQPLSIERSVAGKNGASIVIPFEQAGTLHRLTDPDIGDRLMVVTALGPARGFLKSQYFVELRALPSTHGVVVQPIADDIAAELGPDKITIGRPGGLSLSADINGQQQTVAFSNLTFDTQVWGFDRQAPYNARQSELIRLAAAAPEALRRHARFNLARFYLAREMAAEAKAVLDVAMSEPAGVEDVTGSVLKAVADVMLDRPEQALKELSNPQVANQQDAPVWRAIAHARQGQWPQAHAAFKTIDNVIRTLPIELQRMAMQDEMRAAIEVRDFAGATRVANDFETLGVPPELEPAVAVLSGRLYQGLGRNEDALTSYRAAAASRIRPAAAQGRLREIALLMRSGDIPRQEAIHELETLTTVWRGDETETEGLKILANIYTQDSRYRDAFHVMRTALLAHPNSDMTRQIQDEAAATFDSLFLAGKGDGLPPIEALGLFYDFRELTPIGRRGDEMIRRLADRLVAVDLLDQAAELLQHQVDHRLHGAARSQVATRLAIVYLMNRKPDRALAILQRTRSADLSNELRDQRLLLEARAMSDIGRRDLALEIIANIKGREAIHLRANILWAAKNWRRAAEQIELMHGERWKEFSPLDDSERADILRAAIGYALGDEQIGLLRLREKYAAKMADGPDRRAFDVVTSPIGAGGPEFLDVARRVAATDTLDAFLRDLRTRYPDQPAGPVSDAGKNSGKNTGKNTGKNPGKNAAQNATEAAPAKPVKQADTAMSAPKPEDVSPLPPKVPAGTPLKPDRMPTGSITPRPRPRPQPVPAR